MSGNGAATTGARLTAGSPQGGGVTSSVGIALDPAGACRGRDTLFGEAGRVLVRARHRGWNGYALADGRAVAAASLSARSA